MAATKDSALSNLLDSERQVHDLLKQVPGTVVGARLRRARMRMGMSIRELAAAANVSKNSIVRMEQGGTPNAMTAIKLCHALGMHVASLAKPDVSESAITALHHHEESRWYDLTDFAAGPLGGADRPLSPKERREMVENGAHTPLLILKSRLETGRLLPTVIELYQESERRSHAGEEFAYVLEGTAIIRVGPETHELKAGESITFWSAEEHSYAPAEGSELPVCVLSVRIDDRPR